MMSARSPGETGMSLGSTVRDGERVYQIVVIGPDQVDRRVAKDEV